MQELSSDISACCAATPFLSSALGHLFPAGKRESEVIEFGGQKGFFPEKPCGFVSTFAKKVKQGL